MSSSSSLARWIRGAGDAGESFNFNPSVDYNPVLSACSSSFAICTAFLMSGRGLLVLGFAGDAGGVSTELVEFEFKTVRPSVCLPPVVSAVSSVYVSS